MNIKFIPMVVITAVSVIIAACGGASAVPTMATIIGPLPVQLANNTLADATQVMSDLNYIISQVNTNAAALASNNNFTGANTINSDPVVTTTTAQTLTNKSLTSPAFTGTPSGVIESSAATPTTTAVTNVASITFPRAIYTRVGSVVTVSMTAVINVTAPNIASTARFSLPVASNFTVTTQVIGTAVIFDNTYYPGMVTGDTTGKTLQLDWKSGPNLSETVVITAQYIVI